MAEVDGGAGNAPAKRSKVPLLIGLAGMLALGGGGFYATYSGLLLGAKASAAQGGGPGAQTGGHGASAGGHGAPAGGNVDFVAIPPLLISLGPAAQSAHLRFTADLETAPDQAAMVKRMMPRVLDVLNSYLRAVRLSDLEDPSALTRLRAQMLRRIQTVLGEGMVRDLLITEFVMN